MKLQQAICEEKSAQFVGKTLEVIIDGKLPEENEYCGRTYRDAPKLMGWYLFIPMKNFYLEILLKLL